MGFRRIGVLTLVAGFIAASAPAQAATSDQKAVMATVNRFADGINKGDMKLNVATCASPAIVIDDFAPHVWSGPTACADWAAGFVAANIKSGYTDLSLTFGIPWHVDVTGDTAYVVVPANFTYKANGKPEAENGSVFTAALKKTTAGWRITGWAWAGH
jgi:ketosteroid isomerase-like protein